MKLDMNVEEKKFGVQSWLKSSVAIIEKYKWLIDIYVLDFFVDNHWSILSDNWKDLIDVLTPEHLAFLIDLENDAKSVTLTTVWPLELLALKASIKTYSLKRKPWSRERLVSALSIKEQESAEEWPGEFKKLQQVFRKHIKPKKKHEIIRMADVASMLASKANSKAKANVEAEFKAKEESKNIVDIGGGLGHLSRLLSFGHDFDVTCMEAEGQFGKTAVTFDEDLIKAAIWANSKAKANVEASAEFEEKAKDWKPKHVTLNVDPELRSEIFDDKVGQINKLGLVGLHTCGDLGPTIVRLFAESSKVTSLQSVGCCYMHIKKSFPLSQYLKNTLNPTTFNYTNFELACHAIETYKDRLKNPLDLEQLKVHCRRALMESILMNKSDKLKHKALKPVKRHQELSFAEYALKATENLPKEFQVTNEEVDKWSPKENQWFRVVAMYTLRLLFAPLLETVLLLDRCEYLFEMGQDCTLAPIFDPRLSPRNFVILSYKNQCINT